MSLLERYNWPGNVRQLINTIDRAKILADNNLIRARELPREVTHFTGSKSQSTPILTDELAHIERAKVVEVLRREAGNKTRAARTLGIERRKLYRLVEKYQIQHDELAPPAPQ